MISTQKVETKTYTYTVSVLKAVVMVIVGTE